jgi:predicted HTH transcriptional regulator
MPENQNIEYKSSWRDEYLKWVCGFANANGGKLLIGVNDTGTVIGINNAAKLLEQLPNKFRDILGLFADVNLYEFEGKSHIEIIDACKDAGLPDAILKEEQGGFLSKISKKHIQDADVKIETEENVVVVLRKKYGVNAEELRKNCGRNYSMDK